MSKFVPSNYAVVFEEVMRSPESRENFTEFLRYQHNDEPLLFLNAIDHYKLDYHKTKDALLLVGEKKDNECVKKVLHLMNNAKQLITTYLGNGPKGLNLSQVVIDSTFSMWENVKECLEKINDPNNHYEYYVMIMIDYLDPHALFGKVEYQVILDLSYDQFPRYVRSATLHKFLSKKGKDYTRTIAINVSNGYNVDIRFKPKDFQSQLMTEKDIFFAYTLSEDTPDWKELSYHDKPNVLQTFVSKTSYSIGQDKMKGMKLFKIVMHLPYSVKDVWTTYCDMNTRFKLDNTLMDDFKLLKYISPCCKPSAELINSHHLAYDHRDNIYTTEHPPLALQIGELGILMNLSLFKNRDLPHTMTSIYDESVNCYMNIGHTCKIEDHLRQNKEHRVDAEILFNYMFFGTGEKSTRFIHTVYTDLHIPFDSDLVLTKIWKKRSKQLQQSFEELLHLNTKGGTVHMDPTQINDHFQYFRAVEENSKLNRMWFKEYENKKRRSLSTLSNISQ